jgi:hypothetical protein
MSLPNWIRFSLKPDEVIGGHKMLRWFVLPRNRWFNICVHKHQGDDPRYLHDHPCDNISIRLRGQLLEWTPKYTPSAHWTVAPEPGNRTVVSFRPNGLDAYESFRPMARIVFRRAETPHRLERGLDGRPCWTLWIRFRSRRQWGYFEPGGWRPAVTER